MELFFIFLATVAFSVLFNAPKSELITVGFLGVFGWIIYLLCDVFSQPTSAIFIACFFVTLGCMLMAKKRKQPVTVFLLPSVIVFVPGLDFYYTMYYFIIGDNISAMQYGINTLKVAGSISLGILIALSIPKIKEQLSK